MKIEIPTSYDDVTINEYREVQRIYKTVKPSEVAALEVIALLCNVKPEVMRSVKHKDLEGIIQDMAFLFKPIEDEEFPLRRTFEHEGTTYGFIPNLSKLTVGEFADIDAYTTAGTYDNLHKIMAVLYRPVTEQARDLYAIEPYDPDNAKKETAGRFPMSVALGALVFFWTIGRKLSADTDAYLKGLREGTH